MGFSDDELNIAVKRITSNKDLWLKFMVQEEIGISPGLIDNPFAIGFISAVSFLIGALPAIFSFFIFSDVRVALNYAFIFVLLFLFLLGIAKSKITKINWYISAIETIFVGALSSGIGFLLGRIAAQNLH